MTEVPMTFFSSTHSSNDLYVKSSFNGVDSFYSVNRICGLTRVVSMVAEKSLQPLVFYSEFLNEEYCACIRNNLLFIHEEYTKALFKITDAVRAVLNKNTGERQASANSHLTSEDCKGITELNLSYCGIQVLPPQIELFKNLQKLDLRGNDLKSLPHELKSLPLIEINIQGNNWLQPNLPEWIEQITSVILPNGSKFEKKITNDLQHFLVNSEFSFFL
ncbi:MAG: hypothetical protein H0T62_13820 [Parachlamydiaceae bacterium]|nr:hypothetical protein [Parachlamydiaceae bacterium]